MISCDLNMWLIVTMNFGSNPTYDDSIAWLNQCNNILEKKDKFLIISTFDVDYQFEHKARMKQAKWFKLVKPELKKWCIGMIRVTKDPVMIDKINSAAMKKGVPFKCTAISDADSALKLANQILLMESS